MLQGWPNSTETNLKASPSGKEKMEVKEEEEKKKEEEEEEEEKKKKKKRKR